MFGRVTSLCTSDDHSVSSSGNTCFGHRNCPLFNLCRPSDMKFGSLSTQRIVLRIHMKHSRIWWMQVSSQTLQSDVKPHTTKNLWVNLSAALTLTEDPMTLLTIPFHFHFSQTFPGLSLPSQRHIYMGNSRVWFPFFQVLLSFPRLQ